jgi:hypothetical protein
VKESFGASVSFILTSTPICNFLTNKQTETTLQRQASAVESHSAQIVEISQEFGTTDSNLAKKHDREITNNGNI